jgi:hypothetical protein
MATTTNVPTRKTIAAGSVGAFVTLVIWILNTYVPFFKTQPITGEAASLATTVLSGVAAWIVPPAASEATIQDASGAVKSATA